MNPRTIHLKLEKIRNDSYDILLGLNIWEEALGKEILKINPSRVAFITDTHLSEIYASRILHFKKALSVPLDVIVFRAGEENKNINTIMEMFEKLAAINMDRKSLIIAFGGGVCGDMAGFLSAIYMRGIPFIQVPTSLLAMVDSSVGGKTGVDTSAGKNLAGAFKQPKAVIIDPSFLSTLPTKEFLNGMAEVIKHALIRDTDYFNFLAKQRNKILALNGEIIVSMIERSCQIKASVVEKDETEGGLRQILNLGHTFGHAIEAASDFTIPHGFAVALGILAGILFAEKQSLIAKTVYQKVYALLKNYGLLIYLEDLKKLSVNHILEKAKSDKKNVSGQIKLVLLKNIGTVYMGGNAYSQDISEKEFLSVLKDLKEK